MATHKCVFINQPCIAQALGCEVINRVHGDTTAGKREPGNFFSNKINKNNQVSPFKRIKP